MDAEGECAYGWKDGLLWWNGGFLAVLATKCRSFAGAGEMGV